LVISLRDLPHFQGNAPNIVEKALLLLTGAAFVVTRPARHGIIVLIGAIVIVSFFCAVGTQFHHFQWKLYVGGLVSIVAPFVLLAADPEEKDRLFVLRVFALIPLASVGIGGLYQVLGLHQLFNTDALGALRLGGTMVPAFLAGSCFTAAFVSMELADRQHLGYGALFLANLAILVLTGGRMPLALTLVVCGLYFLRGFQRIPLLKFFAPVYFLVAAGFYLAFFGKNLLIRFQSHSLNGRDALWATVGRALAAHPWFGVGLGNQQLLIPASLTGKTSTIAAHDEYLRIAVELGYPGAFLFFALSIAILLVVWKSDWVRRDPMFLLCAAAFYVYCLTDNAIGTPQNFLFLTAAAFGCGRAREPLSAASPTGFSPRPPPLPAPAVLKGRL
jgi:O-antigen ligase